jgi:hypothetical protein
MLEFLKRGAKTMGEIFEAAMILCFGFSWPVSVYKSWTARTAKGKSFLFSCFVWVGYVCGTLGKILTGHITYVFIFYVLNLCMVSADLCLYYRNWKLDRAAQAGQGTGESGF